MIDSTQKPAQVNPPAPEIPAIKGPYTWWAEPGKPPRLLQPGERPSADRVFDAKFRGAVEISKTGTASDAREELQQGVGKTVFRGSVDPTDAKADLIKQGFGSVAHTGDPFFGREMSQTDRDLYDIIHGPTTPTVPPPSIPPTK